MNSKKLCNDVGRLALLLLAFADVAQGALTGLATEPLPTATTATVLPNLMFVLDDSGSMAWDYMPDQTNSFSNYGKKSSQCNGVYYNPSITYNPPVYADGTSYPNAVFTAALPDGYKASGSGNSPVNLSNTGSSSISYYYLYSGSQTTLAQRDYNNTSSTFYQECDSSVGSSPGNAVFTKVMVTDNATLTGTGYDHNTQNFANWYSYYRTRMLMMKSASGRAFRNLDNHYRVGFTTINNPNTYFLNLAPFDSAQKALWYNKLYTANPNGSTPLRKALSEVGKLYAHKQLTDINGNSLSTTVNDPVQYSCQQNFGLLSTDGFWNSGAGYMLNGTTPVGNQDSTVPRPYYDGAVVSQIQSRTQQLQSSESVLQMQTAQLQKRTSALRKRTGQLQKRTSSNSGSSWTTWSNTSFCTWDTTNPTRTQCQYVWGSWADTASNCTKSYGTATSNNSIWSGSTGTDCQYSDWTDWAGASSCSAMVQSAGPTFTAHPAIDCQTVSLSSWTNANSCTATNTDSNGVTTQCQYTAWSSPINVASCDSVAQSTSPNYTVGLARQCTTTDTGWVNVASCTPSSENGLTVTCNNLYSGGTSDTLADVAQYYYMTDLRTSDLSNCTGALGTDVCTNNVPAGGLDTSTSQHLTLFTLGLGARGRMVFSPTYLSDNSGDYYSVKIGATADPPSVCSWQTSGSGACNWPIPGMGSGQGISENIDDLWHAAVNGRGTYFSATDPDSLATGLASALAGVNARRGSSSSATTSTPNVTQVDNWVFSTTYTTVNWDGELVRQRIDPTTGTIPVYDSSNSQTYDWTARDQLDSNNSRVLYTYDGSSSNHLKPFAWNSLSGTEQGYFSLGSIDTLSQFCATGESCLSSSAQTSAAGENLVAYLAGSRTNEGALTDTSKYYRQRSHVLGDIVDAAVAFVSTPMFTYEDPGYSEYQTNMGSRQGIAYAAANDGMLHAFNATNGAEAWAYVPSFLLPKLYKLADKNYATQHQFFLDGSPVAGDICTSGCDGNSAVWKTILVGGQAGGGRGYYALDVTNPAAPRALWEFTNDNLGYTYGNPIITKLKDGTWVVLVASGYNNVSPGDGQGRLFVINAATGALIRSISTGTGSTGTPSGLARINAWVDRGLTDNTVQRVYAGDLLGNLWRFDVNGDVGASGYDAQLMATLRDAGGNVQPITSKPELGLVQRTAVVFVGTGQHLAPSDPASQQSFYAIKDTLATGSSPNVALFGNPRTNGHFIQQTQSSTTCPTGVSALICQTGQTVRTSTKLPVNFGIDNGWFVDFADSRELVNTDPVLVFGTLLFNTNVYESSACSAGGFSFRYFLDYRTGGFVSSASVPVDSGGVPTSGVVSAKLGDAIASTPSVVKLPSDAVNEIVRLSDGTNVSVNAPYDMPSGGTKRLSWREIDIE